MVSAEKLAPLISMSLPATRSDGIAVMKLYSGTAIVAPEHPPLTPLVNTQAKLGLSEWRASTAGTVIEPSLFLLNCTSRPSSVSVWIKSHIRGLGPLM